MSLMYSSLFFVIGFFAGGVVSYLFAIKLSSKIKLQDELTRTKRELANTKRAVDDFFSNSNDLFTQLDKAYVQYTKYMAKSAGRLSSQQSEMFESQRSIVSDSETKANENKESKFTREMLASQNIVTEKEAKNTRSNDDAHGIIDDVRIIDAKSQDGGENNLEDKPAAETSNKI